MIAIAGEALVDIIVDASGEVGSVVGGAPLNTARTAARLGQATAFIGGVSTDPLGQRIMRLLQADGVAFLGEQVPAPTTLAIAQLDDRGSATYRFMLEGTAAAEVTPEQALAALPPDCPILHVGTLGLVLEPLAEATRALVESAPPRQLVMVDPNCRPSVMSDDAGFRANLAAVMNRADVVKASAEDLGFLYPGVALAEAARRLASEFDGVLLFTDGPHAVRIIGSGLNIELPVPAVPIVDTVGAGDAFSGGFLAQWARAGWTRAHVRDGDAVVAAAVFGIQVAGLTCGRPGADPPYANEVTWPS